MYGKTIGNDKSWSLPYTIVTKMGGIYSAEVLPHNIGTSADVAGSMYIVSTDRKKHIYEVRISYKINQWYEIRPLNSLKQMTAKFNKFYAGNFSKIDGEHKWRRIFGKFSYKSKYVACKITEILNKAWMNIKIRWMRYARRDAKREGLHEEWLQILEVRCFWGFNSISWWICTNFSDKWKEINRIHIKCRTKICG